MPDNNPWDRGYPAEKARQGEIILRKKWQRVVFIAGLAGSALFAILTGWGSHL